MRARARAQVQMKFCPIVDVTVSMGPFPWFKAVKLEFQSVQCSTATPRYVFHAFFSAEHKFTDDNGSNWRH